MSTEVEWQKLVNTWTALAACIRSGQIPQEDVPKLLKDKPDFAAWYRREWMEQKAELGSMGIDWRQQINPTPIYSHQRWDKLLLETQRTIAELAVAKGGEYAGDDDRLANFRRNAADLDLTMEQIWRVYAAKHWDAIGQYVRDLASGRDRQRLEPISGRCDDLIVYLILFKAMVEEREARAEK